MKKVKLIVNNFDNEKVQSISKAFNLTEISAKILLNRGLNSISDVNNFLNPGFEYFEDANNYKDLDKGCKRVIKAIENHEKILIYGDYDVDGTTSISQFVLYLKKVGADVSYYVPERENEGYGISYEFINLLGKMNVDLLITVDCGISEIKAIDDINALGLDVIILDHHSCGSSIPNAFAVINPKQANCKSFNKTLCASGLSFKFLRYLNSFMKIDGIEDILLELACLGTIADIVDLLNDNRIITYNGLKCLNNSKLIGIRKLMEKANISDKTIEAYHVGFILAPRINAAGRMSTAKKAIELMLATDERKADRLATELEELNTYRKQTEQLIYNEAVEKIEKLQINKKDIIIVCGQGWHEGVLGIVASRITEKYEKPSIVVSIKGDYGKASCRSLNYLNIYDALCSVDDLLVKYGGHKLAAGLTIKKSNINEFTVRLNKYVSSIIKDKEILKEIDIDSYITINDINTKLYNEICRFEPYGHGNKKPTFAINQYTIRDIKKVGKDGNHLSFSIASNNKSINIIGFDKINLLEELLLKPKSLIVNINENDFRGNKELQLLLQNIEESTENNLLIDENKRRIINAVINKSKSKIIKTELFSLVNKLNRMYNVNITAGEIIGILKNESHIEYMLKNSILYIKR